MKWFSWGKWDRKAGRWFVYERLYRIGGDHIEWTPFVWITRRKYGKNDTPDPPEHV